MAVHSGMQFSTFDVDNDLRESDNCVEGNAHSAWWHNNCFRANLNGQYRQNIPAVHSMYCVTWYIWKRTHHDCLKFAQMKTRPIA